eukprot:3349622-Rhodomonas_salina.1
MVRRSIAETCSRKSRCALNAWYRAPHTVRYSSTCHRTPYAISVSGTAYHTLSQCRASHTVLHLSTGNRTPYAISMPSIARRTPSQYWASHTVRHLSCISVPGITQRLRPPYAIAVPHFHTLSDSRT